jgi:ribulose-5-phosphate 4-epimerase/fuculose-1-phosphate aldolase
MSVRLSYSNVQSHLDSRRRQPSGGTILDDFVRDLPSGLEFDLPPSFDNVEDERQYRKKRLTTALRIFGKLGFGEGVAGHITVRDPELADHFWVNPFGRSFRLVRMSDLMLVDAEGNVVQGRYPVNFAAFAIHSEVHRARPDVMAVAHSHSVYGRALSALGQLVEPITQDACAFYHDQALFNDYSGLVGKAAEGRRIAATLGNKKAVVLQNHGLLTVGASVDTAAWWFITMERSAQVQLSATACGQPILIDHDTAVLTRAQLGNELAGWINFQPLFQEIVREETDMFE